MKSVSKLALVDPRLVAHESPLDDVLSELERDMTDITQTRNMTIHEKVRKYNQRLQDFLNFKEQSRKPLRVEIEEIPRESLPAKEILQNLPVNLRERGARVLDIIRSSDILSWNAKGELVSAGEAIRGSEIVELVNDVLRQRRYPPVGFEELYKEFKRKNVTKQLVLNKNGHKLIARNLVTPSKINKWKPY